MKACALTVAGELTFTGLIEIKRFMVVLKYISSTLTADEVWHMAQESGCGSIEEEEPKEGSEEKVKVKFISFQLFIRSLRKSVPEVNELFHER